MVSSLDLLQRAQGGDSAALDSLYARVTPALRRWASGRLPGWARDLLDTEDLVQDTVLQTLKHITRFEHRKDGAFHAYLRRALQNRIHNEVRRIHRRPPSSPATGEEADPAPSPLEQTVGVEALERYEAALARLNEDDREAIVMRIEMEASYEDVAAELGRPSADAARVAVARAVVRLAQEMRRDRAG